MIPAVTKADKMPHPDIRWPQQHPRKTFAPGFGKSWQLWLAGGLLAMGIPGCSRDSQQETAGNQSSDELIAAAADTEADLDALLSSRESYLQAREELLQQERSTRQLESHGKDAQEADAAVAELRLRGLKHGDWEGRHPAVHPFLTSRQTIEKTELFRILKRMPKGAALHVHSSSAGNAEWLFQWLKDCPECWIRTSAEGSHQKFGDVWFAPADQPPKGFTAAAEILNPVSPHCQPFKKLFQMDSGARGPAAWKEFNRVTSHLGGVLNYQPLFAAYFEHVFRSFAEDHVTHLELRSGFGNLFDLTGRKWNDEEFVGEYQSVLDKVRKDHPHFTCRLIMNAWRGAAVRDIRSSMERTLKLCRRYPEFVVGFDLVGCEQAGGTTRDDLDVWLSMPSLCAQYDVDLQLFLHDGESASANDMNLFDAYLLGSRRIGHGINLDRFPKLEQAIRRRGTTLEICPVSNQALGYVNDLRQHPADGLIRRGVRCVISNDDPFMFGNHGLSYDFWSAVVAWELTLPEVRTLCRNSLEAGMLGTTERLEALARWELEWAEYEIWLARGAP